MKKTICLCLYAFLFVSLFHYTSSAQTMGVIHTFAGGGSTALGDGGPATAACLTYPTSVYASDINTLFVVSDNRIRYVPPSGIITTFSGNGTAGYTGDGEPATAATINPGQTNVFGNPFNAEWFLFSDSKNNVIRQFIAPGWTIVTTVGNGTAGFGGDGGPATAALLDTPGGVDDFTHAGPPGVAYVFGYYIADMNNNRIRCVVNDTITTVAGTGVPGFSGDGGPAIAACLDHPSDVKSSRYLDINAFFIADWGNRRIRKVDTLGIIRTYAGNGTAGYTGDGGPATGAGIGTYGSILIDAQGTLYIAGGNTVRKVDATTGIITTVVGNGITGYSGDGGSATSASLSDVRGASFDYAGNLFIADAGNNCIRKVDSVGGLAVNNVLNKNINISLTSNPNNGTFTIKGSVKSIADKRLLLNVTDVCGRVVYASVVEVQNGNINKQVFLDNVVPGIYILHIGSTTEVSTMKFVVE